MSVLAFPSPASARPEQNTSACNEAGHSSSRQLEAFGKAEPPDAEERRKALDINQSWIVEAPAGSGKTGLLIQRYLKLLVVVDQPEAVLALTFTNKATAEMRNRVLEVLDRAADALPEAASSFKRETRLIARNVLLQDAARGWRLREHPHRLNIRTIDSFCGEIAHWMPVLSGGIGLARPTPNASDLYAMAARRVFLHFGGHNSALNRAIETVLLQRDGNLADCEALLAEMLASREQWGELVPLDASLLDEATLDREVRLRLDEALENTICAALSELRDCCDVDLLRGLAEAAHALREAEGYGGQPNPLRACVNRFAPGAALADLEHWRALASLLITNSGTWRRRLNVNDVGLPIPGQNKKRLLDLISQLQGKDALLPALCAIRELPPERYPDEQWRVAKALFALLRQALIELRLLFAERETCDFTELSIAARTALRDTEGAAFHKGMRLEHLLVDEMQDTSSSQYDLLESLTEGWDGHSQTVFLVGDPKQSIYLFRQARVERFIVGMQAGRLGKIQLGPLHLTANFRSGAVLVHEFNAIFRKVFPSTGSAVAYQEAIAIQQPSKGEELRWHADPLAATADRSSKMAGRRRADREEAEAIAKLARDWRKRPLPPDRREPWKIAVLVRARSHVFQVTRKLAEAQVPFRAVEIEHLNERPEVLDCIALTRALLHPADRVAWLAVLRAPWCGLSLHDLHTLAAGDQPQHRQDALRGPFRDRLPLLPQPARARAERTLAVLDAAVAERGRAPVAQAVERAWASLGGDLCIDALARTNVRRFLELLEEMDTQGGAIDAHRLAARTQRLFAEPASASDAVDVMTIHKAKGLEWDLVLVPGMQKGGGRNPFRLLDWMELPTRGKDGRAQVLLAPIPARGDDPGTLNAYLRKQRANQERAELKRLLYVVTTRARTSLQVFASPRRTASGTIELREGSLLKAASAALPQEFTSQPPQPVPQTFESAIPIKAPGLTLALAASSSTEDVLPPEVPSILQLQRLPIEVCPRERLQRLAIASLGVGKPEPGPSFHPKGFARPHGSPAARALGNAVHAFLEHLALRFAAFIGISIGTSPLDKSSDRVWLMVQEEMRSWRPRVEAVVRSNGLPARETHRVATLAMQALQNTLAHDNGRWLLQPHHGAVSEAEFTASEDSGDGTHHLRLDRSFFAGEAPGMPGRHVLWIVDYKTAALSGSDLTAFLTGERAKYEPQLRAYAEARLHDLPAATPVMLALFHPLLPKLQYWPYEG